MKGPRFTLFGFRRPREVVCSTLGKLEKETLEELWRRGEASVREIYHTFEKRTAYTTLMTTLDRLYKKALLNRHKEGRAFIYSPRITREEFEQGVNEDVIDGLLGHSAQSAQPILACFVDAVGERDRELLDELARLVKDKRRKVKSKD
ncbi:MAG TPA: BlaI/MecI/CopY family transcriptional regulator [Pyrinomonadaceae bacterium]|jgi:predicted transcriptional regulator